MKTGVGGASSERSVHRVIGRDLIEDWNRINAPSAIFVPANCLSGFAFGIQQRIAKIWPHVAVAAEEARSKQSPGFDLLGTILPVSVGRDKWVLLGYSQFGYGQGPIHLRVPDNNGGYYPLDHFNAHAITSSINAALTFCEDNGIDSKNLFITRMLNCVGGRPWVEVEALIEDVCSKRNKEVMAYLPNNYDDHVVVGKRLSKQNQQNNRDRRRDSRSHSGKKSAATINQNQ